MYAHTLLLKLLTSPFCLQKTISLPESLPLEDLMRIMKFSMLLGHAVTNQTDNLDKLKNHLGTALQGETLGTDQELSERDAIQYRSSHELDSLPLDQSVIYDATIAMGLTLAITNVVDDKIQQLFETKTVSRKAYQVGREEKYLNLVKYCRLGNER